MAALGVAGNTLPPLIYRMRQLGYPPGWLKEAEMEDSGLSLYDGNGMFSVCNHVFLLLFIIFLNFLIKLTCILDLVTKIFSSCFCSIK